MMNSDCLQPESAIARAGTASVEPDAVSASLLKIWQEILHISAIQPDDDFFELGGDSLGAIRMLERIGREFGDELLEPDVIYSTSSFSKLAAAISDALLQAQSTAASNT
ncbi:phosphopantetheine-binding protein [Uliginosibacterium sp. H3]|uniref:Phosphopantetheine-binding protein n=1 Tax=Uliginosibacterium silvisoli TaxID=3114758 RepID=A0ABU6K9X2_9RHOO|nr:phosphopantetheine-binding protein [Uliginosibacterium sp. H3]